MTDRIKPENKKELTQERLKELIHYNPDTGVLTWKQSVGRVKSGDVAGWKNLGYIYMAIDGIHYKAHRIAWFYMKGVWPRSYIDHKDHVRSNNAWNNIREATDLDNQRNRTLSVNNTSGYCGVCFAVNVGKWGAAIGVNGKKITLGYYSDKSEAINVRKAAEKHYGFHPNHGATK